MMVRIPLFAVLLVLVTWLILASWFPRYSDTIVNLDGEAIPGVSVYVYQAGSGTSYPNDGVLVTLYKDRLTLLECSNPMTTDECGGWSFVAKSGIYDIYLEGDNVVPWTFRKVH